MSFLKKYFAVLTGTAIFIIYLTTLAPTVIQIDSGELTAVQVLAGIAHPTGYPLFTMLGYLFALIPLPFTKVYQLNILAAVWCGAGAALFIYTSKFVLDNISFFQKKENNILPKNKKGSAIKSDDQVISIPEGKKYLASILAGFALAFSQTFWFQSTSVEVYSFHIALLNLIILLSLKAYISYLKKDDFNPKAWIFLAMGLALGFSNHMTTLLVLPGIAYLYFEKNKFNLRSYKIIGIMLAVFIPLLILIYLYLPLKASADPILNWGNPNNFERFFRHISGKQYQVWLFSSTAAAKKQLAFFLTTLPAEFSIVLLISVLGIFVTFFMARKFFYFSLINLIFTVFYSINYDIHDIDSYFLLAYISLAFFTVFGIIKILSVLKIGKYSYSISAVALILFIAVEGFINYQEVDQSNTYSFKDYSTAVISSVSKNGIIFTYQWDYLVSPSYYFQFVENNRKDVVIIDKELLRRSWYYNQLKTDYPLVLKRLGNVVNKFLAALKPFENDQPYNPALLEKRYRELMTGLVSANITKRDFYVGPELFENEMQRGEFVLPPGYTLVPDLFLFKVVKGKKYIPAANPDFKIRFPQNKNHYTKFIENIVGTMLTRRALYEMQYDKIERAKIYIQKIKNDLPDYKIPQGLEQVLIR